MLTEERAEDFAAIALGHVEREYPFAPGLVLNGPDDLLPPRALHPAFHGSLDWHSCVHSHWLLARLLWRFPGLDAAGPIRALFDRAFTPDRIAGECATFARPGAKSFERPYGWAWLLKLAAELRGHAPHWGAALAPLASLIAGRLRAFLPSAAYPVRTGTHGNTAFALRLATDFAEDADPALATLIAATARRWYLTDAACQAWEPGGDDFLSPALVEAECLRRLLPEEEFLPWFADFLPRLAEGRPATLFAPVAPGDPTDGKLAHLDGLNLSRAWCWQALSGALPPGHPAQARIASAVAAHRAAGLPHLQTHYMGEHWLATFAVLALDGA